ncbi:MAG: ABC transporter substrate-binding protein [Rhodobacteraceae bacterium]|nr:ABC transporter substrate-binding protein [Paracoccaceae bacterium]MCW9042200.1 ABC transporter substrate-binding protein [Pseudopelagicola sp.]
MARRAAACISVSVRPSKLISLLAALVLSSAAAWADAPRRVVSLNLCTDQLAMLLAAPGQLKSVSYISRDKRASAMTAEAAHFPINHGGAEEIYLLNPDLVLAGTYSSRATVNMLRRLGIPVHIMAPALTLDAIPERISEIGRVLGRDATAAKIRAQFESDLAELRKIDGPRPRAAIYNANGWTPGENSLPGQILKTAGFTNVATQAGFAYGGEMPLELLIMAQPDLIVSAPAYDGHSRAEDILDHPALRALTGTATGESVADNTWICGTPHVLDAVRRLAKARRALLAKAD